MKSLKVVIPLLVFFAARAFAGCPEVLNPDDPPCVPCPYELTGEFIAVGTLGDGSSIHIHGRTFTNCDDDSYETVETYIVCPNGPNQPCEARDQFCQNGCDERITGLHRDPVRSVEKHDTYHRTAADSDRQERGRQQVRAERDHALHAGRQRRDRVALQGERRDDRHDSGR